MIGSIPTQPRSFACLCLLLCLAATRGIAQGARVERARTWPVDSVLAHVETDMRHRLVNSMANDVAFSILYLPEAYAARKDSLLDGLERMAIGSGDDFVRSMAAGRIAFAGQGGSSWRPVPGTMHRLARIYRTTSHQDVRLTILDRMPLLAERGAAFAFLRSVARDPDPADDRNGPHDYFSYGDPKTRALIKLSEMGEDGRAVLQAMHRTQELTSPQGRVWLDEFARRGFPVTDVARALREPSPPPR